jgi:hypothetical protein
MSAEQAAIAATIAKKRIMVQRVARRQRFIQQYRDDWCAFTHDCFKWDRGKGPTPYQDDIMVALPRYKRESVRGPHGLGKTALASWYVHWFVNTRDGDVDWKVPTTAGSWRQLTHFLWPEIRKWAHILDWGIMARDPYDPRTELLHLELKGRTGRAFAVASTTPELIEGAHADSLGYVYDESKIIPPEIFDASEGAFAGAGAQTGIEAFAFSMSTPGPPEGRFFDIQTRKPGYEDWHVRAVTLRETLDAGRVSPEWVDARKRQWGEHSAVFINRVLGEFAASDEDALIPLAWVEAAMERGKTRGDTVGALTSIGADIGDSGDDKTVLAERHERHITALTAYAQAELMDTANRLAGRLLLARGVAVVDVIGIGAGVVSRLRELKVRVLPFNAAERADATDASGELAFVNKRAHGWWHLRELLDPAHGHDVSLPDDDTLLGDLTAPRWKVIAGGKIQIEGKDDIRKRIGRSTDYGDAVVHAFYSDFYSTWSFEGVSLVALPKVSLWTPGGNARRVS